MPLEFGYEFYRTMVAAVDVGEDGGISQLRIEPFGGDEVVDAPPGIFSRALKWYDHQE